MTRMQRVAVGRRYREAFWGCIYGTRAERSQARIRLDKLVNDVAEALADEIGLEEEPATAKATVPVPANGDSMEDFIATRPRQLTHYYTPPHEARCGNGHYEE